MKRNITPDLGQFIEAQMRVVSGDTATHGEHRMYLKIGVKYCETLPPE